jgi:hypothetical protein
VVVAMTPPPAPTTDDGGDDDDGTTTFEQDGFPFTFEYPDSFELQENVTDS